MTSLMTARASSRGSRWGQIRFLIGWTLSLVVLLLARDAHAQLRVAARSEGVTTTGLELASERAMVSIDRQHATTTITHEYMNRTGTTVEGWFQFRAGDGANVDGFAYWNGSQKIVGEVLERSQAKQIYESTTQRRRDPGLLEKTAEGTFQFRVFPIAPNERKRVEIRIDQWLERRSRVVELRLPMSRPNSEIEVDIVDDRPIKRVRSSSHDLEIKGDGTTRVRVLAGPRLLDDKPAGELVLQYELGDAAFQPTAWVHRDTGNNGYFLLTLAAPKASAELSQDLTLVVDGSNTEAGALARKAAGILVKKARAADRLNLIVAASGFDAKQLASRPVWVTDDVRKEALALLLETPTSAADVSGALKKAYAAQEGTGRNRTIVLLSGAIPSGRELLSSLKDNLDKQRSTRVFTVGFGSNVDRAAFNVLAAESRGRFLLVESAGALPERVGRLAQQIAAPVLVDISVEVEGAEIAQVYPRTIPDLYQEQEIRVSGRIRGKGKARIAIRGRAGKDIRLVTSVELADVVRHPFVAKLWGRERIAHLLEDVALFGSSPEKVDETIELALAYNVVTPYTAFLAIPESELTAQSKELLGSLRQQKLAVLSKHPDADVALAGKLLASEETGGGDNAPVAMSAPEPPSPSGELEGKRGGCAGCSVPRESGSRAPLIIALLGLLVAWRRRARARSA
jgi:Ca-activated chloride channel homolog